MILSNKILWSNDMSLAVGLKTELDEDEFVAAAIETHLDLTGETFCKGEYIVDSDMTIRRLEII